MATAALPLWQASPGMYSTVSVLLLKRSGSEHDLTGWPDNIPTSPGVCLAFLTATWDTASTVFNSMTVQAQRKINLPGGGQNCEKHSTNILNRLIFSGKKKRMICVQLRSLGQYFATEFHFKVSYVCILGKLLWSLSLFFGVVYRLTVGGSAVPVSSMGGTLVDICIKSLHVQKGLNKDIPCRFLFNPFSGGRTKLEKEQLITNKTKIFFFL